MQVPCEVAEVQDAPTLFALLQQTALFLWKDWPRDMEVVGHDGNGNFSFRGTCPHSECNRASVFLRVQATNVGSAGHTPQGYPVSRYVAVLQCQGCHGYILGMAKGVNNQSVYVYEGHYPLGTPNDTVADEIPEHIKPDFKEALRCRFVDAYNATAEMCRRAIEASCLDLGAPKRDVLEDMIDWLEVQRKITPFLKEVAHKIRLGGNRGAHPPEDGPVVVPLNVAAVAEDAPVGPVRIITKEHADAIIEFTWEFFHHVYVVPKQLAKYDFSKPKAKP